MGGGGSKGSSSTTQTASLAPELRPLFAQSGQRVLELQTQAPLTPFLAPAPQAISPLSGLERLGAAQVPQLFTLAGRQTASLAPFLIEQPRQIAPLSDLERFGLAQVPLLSALAGRRVTGETLAASPAIAAARQAFQTGIEPTIVNQLTLSGLGRSTALPQALAAAEAQVLLPVIQEELAREERAIGREAALRQAGIEQALQAGAIERGVAQAALDARLQDLLRRQAVAGEEIGRQEREIARQAGLVQAGIREALGAGALEREVAQAALDAAMQDFLRRQALAEQALFGPFGQLLPAGISQQAVTRSRTKGGGLFK